MGRQDSRYDRGNNEGSQDGITGDQDARADEPVSDEQRALIALPNRGLPTVPLSDEDLLIVPGDGVPMGTPFIQRRERPLS
ncbi:MAG TPA: hypothetical protein VFU63_12700, partial [Ktedonobacterales bacterium]|nr:hypothetical protein [Ktedonobacterales bacterium]